MLLTNCDGACARGVRQSVGVRAADSTLPLEVPKDASVHTRITPLMSVVFAARHLTKR